VLWLFRQAPPTPDLVGLRNNTALAVGCAVASIAIVAVVFLLLPA